LWSPRKASSGGSPGVDPAALWKSQEAADPALILGRVRRLEIRTRRVVDQILTGEYHSIFRGQGMEFHEVRPYVAGDEVRTIDWNVTARAGVPYVKTFVETRELTVLLMVDVSASSLFGTGTASKRDLVEETAALLIFSAIRNRDRVGLVLFSDRVEKVILPRRGRRHGLRLLSELLEFRPRGRGSDLTEPLEAAAKLLRRRALVFILCDFLLPDASGVLKRVVRRHDVIPVVIEDPREESLPAVGLVELEDLETGRRSWVDTGHPGVRRRFAEKAAQRAQGQKTMFGRLGLDAVWLRTGVDPARPLQKLFQLRMRRRSGGTAVRGTSRVVAP
jgi:uncharacterized protein (DUF58 family)